MQFTGLLDKNDKEIYEGDIVNYGYETAEGDWEEVEGFMEWDLKLQIGLVVNSGGILRKIVEADLRNIEIIGNICENPELTSFPDK